jgi:hypothetical protein
MRKADAVAHFQTQLNLARAVRRAASTVSEWGDVVPLEDAWLLERLTEKLPPAKRLKIDPSLYPRVNAILRGRA